MKFFFWGMLSNSILGLILTALSFNSDVSYTVLSTLVFYGLILKGIFSLNKTETHFRTVMVLAVILMAGGVIQFLGNFINNSFINSIVAWFAMVTSVAGLFAEYNLIKGIQSYNPVLSQPKQTDKLMLYWKITLFTALVMVVTLLVALFAFVIVIIMTYGLEQSQIILDKVAIEGLMMDAIRANGVFSVVLLVIALSAALTNITARILLIVSMYGISKDHKQGLVDQFTVPAVE